VGMSKRAEIISGFVGVDSSEETKIALKFRGLLVPFCLKRNEKKKITF
jgi:hypothetical protein